MRAVSDAFLRTIRGSHRPRFRATVCETFQSGTTPTGTQIEILDGEVTLDGTADVRSTLTLTTDGTRAWPTRVDSLLAPYGNEVYIERGVQYHDGPGGIEYVGLGYFRIEEPEQPEAPDGPITIGGSDRMVGIQEAYLLAPQQISIGTTLGDVLDDLVLSVFPDAVIEWDDDTDQATIFRTLVCERDRFKFLNDLVRSHGKVWYWDHRGILVIRSTPSESTPVFDIEYGPGRFDEGGVLTRMSRSLSRRGVFNAVVANGQGTDTVEPAHGVAIDTNPDSPTYFYGRFGQVPMFYTSSAIGLEPQADAAAGEILRQRNGLPYSVSLELTPHPGLEPWDPVTVRAAGHESAERHLLAVLSIPLVAEVPMAAATRQKTVVLTGSA